MTYVERRLQLRQGPPWGFRLYEDMMHGLMVSKVRRRSPADLAGMQEGDQVLAINGYDAIDMSHARAVQIIDFAAYTLELIVGRYERMQRMETIYLDNAAFRARQTPQELTTTELQLFWEKQTPLKPSRPNWPPSQAPPSALGSERTVYTIPSVRSQVDSPPPQQYVWKSAPIQILPKQSPAPVAQPIQFKPVSSRSPYAERRIQPQDPDVTSVSVDQLMRQFDVPPIAPELKKKAYADSTFYSDPTKYYPTIEEQIEMARRVADSLQDPDNMFSRGVNIFEKQRQHADKYVREGPEPERDPIAEATPEELQYMTPPSPPPPPHRPPPSFPGLEPVNRSTVPIPPPPPLLPGQPKTVQEFLEKIKVFPVSRHDDLDPQKCFDIATALYQSDSRGAKMFAKRHARAKKWDSEAENEEAEQARPQPMVATLPAESNDHNYKNKLMSKLETAPQVPPHSQAAFMQRKTSDSVKSTPLAQQNLPKQAKISLESDQNSATSDSKMDFTDAMPKPFGQATLASQGINESQMSTSFTASESSENQPSGWRPVKFKVPAKTEQ